MKTHTLVHTNELPPIVIEHDNQCPKCGLIQPRARNFHRHVKYCKGKKPFPCDLCHQSFLKKRELIEHKKEGNHTNFRINKKTGEVDENMDIEQMKQKEKKVCPKCGLSRWNMQYHMKACKGKRKYQCDLCPKSYGKNNDLNTHKRNKHGEEASILDMRIMKKVERVALENIVNSDGADLVKTAMAAKKSTLANKSNSATPLKKSKVVGKV